MIDPTVVSIISVIITGVVAVTGHLVPFVGARSKADREVKERKLDAIRHATVDVLQKVAFFEVEWSEASSEFTQFRAALHVWRAVVIPYLGETDREELARVVRASANVVGEIGTANATADCVLALSQKACDAV